MHPFIACACAREINREQIPAHIPAIQPLVLETGLHRGTGTLHGPVQQKVDPSVGLAIFASAPAQVLHN